LGWSPTNKNLDSFIMRNFMIAASIVVIASGFTSCQKCGYCYYRNPSNPQASYSGEEVCGQPEYDEAREACDIGNPDLQRWIPN